jgi:GIY-YIG catalytic domain
MFYVYLLASKPYGTLYVGLTNELARRVWEHKIKAAPGSPRGMASTGSFGSRAMTRQKPRCCERSRSRNGNGTGN